VAEKPEWKKSLGRLRIRREDNIKLRKCCEHHNEALGNIKGLTFLDYTSVYRLLTKGCAPWN
jgi:hypothetical protein